MRHIVVREFLYRSNKGFGYVLWIDTSTGRKAEARKSAMLFGMPSIGAACPIILQTNPADAHLGSMQRRGDVGSSRMRGGYGV